MPKLPKSLRAHTLIPVHTVRVAKEPTSSLQVEKMFVKRSRTDLESKTYKPFFMSQKKGDTFIFNRWRRLWFSCPESPQPTSDHFSSENLFIVLLLFLALFLPLAGEMQRLAPKRYWEVRSTSNLPTVTGKILCNLWVWPLKIETGKKNK